MEVYCFTNKVSGKVYVGISKNAHKRKYSHVFAAKSGSKTPFYDAVRSYGWEAFSFEVLATGLSEKEASQREVELISKLQTEGRCYNLHLGGHIGFDVRTKGEEQTETWRLKLKEQRKGRQPALGLKHSEENKKLFGECGKRRWDIEGRFNPDDVLSLPFLEANKKYGISKTHYYRLRKARLLA